MTHLVVVGDALLDRDVEGDAVRLTPDAPAPVLDEREIRTRPGGAALAATLAARDGCRVTLVTAIGRDAAGDELRDLVAREGVRLVDLGSSVSTPEKIRLRARRTSLVRWDRGGTPGPHDLGEWTTEAAEALRAADGVLVSCYGRGISCAAQVRAAIGLAARRVPITWDPHPRGAEPLPGCALVTPNADEAAGYTGGPTGAGLSACASAAEVLVGRWQAAAVVVTRGAQGAVLSTGSGLPLVVPAAEVLGADACGAGDRFAATAARHLAEGRIIPSAVGAAVAAASRFVAAGGAAQVLETRARRGDRPDGRDALGLVRAVHADGGTVVTTGGCFDLLHAGHVALLQAARRLGDVLVVCLNSDSSVRRLKGTGRPVVGAADRQRLLEALACVDAVALFDEDTPVDLLRRLRPDVFVKGGDYGHEVIPEAAVLASWGGRAVTLPYLAGHSTSRLLEEVRTRAST